MKRFFLFLYFVSFAAYAQENDTIQSLNEVVLTSFQRQTSLLSATTSVHQIKKEQLQLNHPERLLESFNLIPGTKMEERSPGSYRLSLRGSTIRSPFGVRNVKIYFDDFILTDATGNAYLNLIEPQFIQSVEVMKGPQGSEYGVETGGVVILKSNQNDKLNAEIGFGSYEMWNEKIQFGKQFGKHHLQLGQSHYNSNGYREQSGMQRSSFFIKDQWKYNSSNVINLIALYTDLDYQTPGGLTLSQMQNNRKQARLATTTLPSAVEQKTGIINKTFLGGINHLWKINSNWNQFTLFQTSFTDFSNPFISNYEKRKENNLQGRIYFDYTNKLERIRLNTRFGSEIGWNKTLFKNYDNLKGTKGDPQKFDNINTWNTLYYISQQVNLNDKWNFNASLSINPMQYEWKTTFPFNENGSKKFKTQWLPQFSLNYKLNQNLSIRGKIAKGISSPTTEEVRSSNQDIQNNLNAEYGWNKEIGIRKNINDWSFEVIAFYYDLKDAIVRRQDENGNDYFINAGGTKQKGLEFLIENPMIKFNHPFFNSINLLWSAHLYDFKYDNYKIGSSEYSENKIPGVSALSTQAVLGVKFLKRFNLQFSNYYNSKLYLNDANTVEEKGFIIGNLYFNSNFQLQKSQLSFFAGINNLYNTKYSAGYDLNAFGNRFYNPSATTNYYLGTKFSL